MIILGLDTTNGKCAVSLARDASILSKYYSTSFANPVARLPEIVQNVTRTVNIDDIDIIASAIGPGNFTGCRIASSFALGYATGIEYKKKIIVSGVLNTESIYYSACELFSINSEKSMVIIKASKSSYYTQFFHQFKSISEINIMNTDEIRLQLSEDSNLLLIGDLREFINVCNKKIDHESFYSADSICKIARNQFNNNEIYPCQPLYIKPLLLEKSPNPKRLQ